MIVKGTREATVQTARHATEHTALSTAQADTAHGRLLCGHAFLADRPRNIGNIAVLLRCPKPITPFSPAFFTAGSTICVQGKPPALLRAFVTLVNFPSEVLELNGGPFDHIHSFELANPRSILAWGS